MGEWALQALDTDRGKRLNAHLIEPRENLYARVRARVRPVREGESEGEDHDSRCG